MHVYSEYFANEKCIQIYLHGLIYSKKGDFLFFFFF
jgi:hypothetical protein